MSLKRLWHKSYASDVPAAINLEKITMAEVLTRTANKYPERVAFIYMGKKITFRQLEKLVNQVHPGIDRPWGKAGRHCGHAPA